MDMTLAASLCTTMWAGVVLGISFVAQPAKFSTPGLSRPIALAAGRQMFRAMHRTEAALAAAAVVLALNAGAPFAGLLCAAALILAWQVLVLMPALSRRVDDWLEGRTPPAGSAHLAFAALETIKLATLLAFTLSPLFYNID